MTAAHNSGALMPSTQNARPPSAPCTIATTTLPFTVARMTVVNLPNSCRLSSSFSGIASRMPRANERPSRSRKNARYSVMKKLTTTSSVSCPMLSTLVAKNWLKRPMLSPMRRWIAGMSARP